MQVSPFESKKAKIKIKKEDEKDKFKKEQEKEEAELSTIIKELSIYDKKNIDPNKLKPQDLEIDDDTSGHIDFIHISAHLRAKNYNIKEWDKFKTRKILGDIIYIIPTIITTASTITGLASLQLYTLYQTNKINFMRDCYLNLGINSIIMSEPKSVIRKTDKESDPILLGLGPVKAIPPGWTVWDKIIIKKSMTCKELIDYIMKKYKVEVSFITAGSVDIIQTFMPSAKSRMNQKIEDIYNDNSKIKLDKNIKYLYLEISGDIGEAIVLMPKFKYIFKN